MAVGKGAAVGWKRLGPRLRKPGRWKEALDITLKLAALAAILAGGFHFLLSTTVVAGASSQRLIDRALLIQRYADHDEQPPRVVLDAVDRYNKANLRDLKSGSNDTLNQLTRKELCTDPVVQASAAVRRKHRAVVDSIVGDGYCEAPQDSTEGRGRYYQRLLAGAAVMESKPRLTARQAVRAVREIEGSLYRRYRVCVRNVGAWRAVNVHVTGAAGYRPVAGSTDAFDLGSTDETSMDFESEHGYLNALPTAVNVASATTTTSSLSSSKTSTTTTMPSPAVTAATNPSLPNVDIVNERGEVVHTVPGNSCMAGPGVSISSDFVVTFETRPNIPAWVIGLMGAVGLLLLMVIVLSDDGSSGSVEKRYRRLR